MKKLTLPEIVKEGKHSIKRGPFGGALKKEIFKEDGYVVYEQQHAIYKDFDSSRYFIDDEKYEELNAFKVESGDLIISCSGTIGKIAEVPSNYKAGIINQALLKLTLNEEIVSNKYFIYLFESDLVQNELFNLSHGSGLKNFPPMSVVKAIKFPLPPLDQQKKIAAILDAADAYRQKTKALIAKYDELTQSLFLDMFGDPVTNPKGWGRKKFGALVENKDSKRVPIKSSDRDNSDGTTPYYGASGVIDFVEGFTHEGENLLIGEDGANLVTRTKPIAFIAKGKYWVNNHAHVLGENGNCKLKYLEFFINSIDLKPYVSGSAQPKLNRKNMDSILLSNPPIELQNQFAESVQAIETQKAQAQASFEKAEELFNSLLQRAFKGELTNA